MTKEIWKPIRGYTGLYEISNKGRVKSLARKVKSKNGCDRRLKTRILTQGLIRGKWHVVVLYKKGDRKGFHVPTLLSRTFKTK